MAGNPPRKGGSDKGKAQARAKRKPAGKVQESPGKNPRAKAKPGGRTKDNKGPHKPDIMQKPRKPEKPGGSKLPESPSKEPVRPLDSDYLDAMIGELSAKPPARVDHLDYVTGKLLGEVKERFPGSLPQKPPVAGQAGLALPLKEAGLGRLLRLAAGRSSNGVDRVIWDDGTSTVMVRLDGLKVEVGDGIVTVSIPYACEEAEGEMRVPFAVGSKERIAGMVLATADQPLGDPLVARVWGDALIALAYEALIDAVESLAGATGTDDRNQKLVPRGLRAMPGRLLVESQGRFNYPESKQ